MNVLSTFNGMGCIWIVLDRLGIKVNKRYSSEIDKYANQVNDYNYPDTIQLGDVCNVRAENLEPIDLLVGGSPCQGFSFAGKQLAFDDPRSKLFFEFVRLLKECRPKYFLFENVRMKKEYLDIISEHLGVEPICINSVLVSAQNRVRYYWTNIPNIKQPEDKGVLLTNIIEHGYVDRDKSYCVDAHYFKGGDLKSYFDRCRRQLVFETPHGFNKGGFNFKDKFNILRVTTPYNYAILDGVEWRKLTPIECERLQTVPDDYTKISNLYKYFMCITQEINNNGVFLCKNKNVVLADVIDKQQHINMENSVLYIINDMNDMVQLNYLKNYFNQNKNVSIVIEKLEKRVAVQEECVINITKIGDDTETHYSQIIKKINWEVVDTENVLMVKTFTGKLWKIVLDDNLQVMKKFIISILIKLIIELKIFSFVMDKVNIQLSIDNLNKLRHNLLKVELSGLKMENITFVSNSQRYKMLGNGWTVDVIAHILKGCL